MNYEFVLEKTEHEVEVPSIEDAKSDYAPYYSSFANGRTEVSAQTEVVQEMAKLGGYVTAFFKGSFKVDGVERYGFKIEFMYSSARGKILVAGLPIKRTPTKRKISQVRVQALMIVRDWLKAAVTAQVFSPGSNPLLPHLLLPDGKTTIAEYIAEQQTLPLLNPAPAQDIIVER